MNNNPLLEEIFYALSLPLLLLAIHYFYSRCFVCRIERKPLLVFCYTMYGVCHLLLHHSSLPAGVTLGLNIGSIALLAALYRGSLFWRVCGGLFLFALMMLCEMMIPVYTTIGYILVLFVSKLMLLFLVYIWVRIAKAYGEGHLSGWYSVPMICCPLLILVGVPLLAHHSMFLDNPSLFTFTSIGLLLINFLLFALCDRALSAQAAQHRNRLLEQQNAYYVNQYLMTRDRQQETNQFQHDFKHILLGLRAKWLSGAEQETLQELDALLGRFEQHSGICSSGNLMIDSILNYKQQAAKAAGITFSHDLKVPPGMELDTVAISVILGNTLDNAVEACTANPAGERYINIQMQYLNESLFIRVQNPYSQPITRLANGDIATTKADKQAHGLGLSNMRKIIADANGLLDISVEQQLFTVEVVLFNIARAAS
ncbi:ATP-binding protein [Paenibacillus donghaensis]|uniref:Sensor histidine kinase NatK-like C-terminal domain-containing protein n=1 Tax=Paenibacillus donghaensis TaxID=414771 RepID=A0A2Z2KIA7_9BACL|nr:sensor histidine kinase [Paenibacillus donghaensis]ASA23023.1 hypothetical protein B9T62_20760 [Paenibacillus donghaensis]